MEFMAAHKKALQDKIQVKALQMTNDNTLLFQRVIVIKHGELMAEAEMEEDLQNYLKMNTYLDSADPWFWPKLRCVAELNWGREVIFLNSLFLDTHCHTEERSLPLEKGFSGPHSIRLNKFLVVSDNQ